jgi:signal transduction histidine kinase
MKLRGKFSLLIGLVLFSTFGATFYLASSFQHALVLEQAERQARMLSQQILLTRRWVADHDGLFVIKKPGVASNPYLSSSDIVDQSGHVYVKRNPAMVTRELSEYAAQVDFCRFRVTSLQPVNPANTPDAFERQGLHDFENGGKEVTEIVQGSSGRTLRYMIPLKVEESCLPCHAEQGYRVGDIRGGLSLEVPIAWADEAIVRNNRLLLVVGLATIAVTSLVIFLLMNFLVVRRLAALAGAMDTYPNLATSGELPGGGDEIGDLSRKFTALGERLERSQDDLARTREQVFQSEKLAAVGQLAAGVAHEVNNPLGGMRNCLKSLKESPDDRAMRDRYLELIDKGLLRIGHIVRQLLNFSRETPLCLEKVDIDTLIRECFELLAFQLKDIRLKLELGVSSRYRLDGGVLKQALVNIALNAIQAMPEGGELRVVSRETDSAVRISLRDTGPGIPPADLDRIFEPFYTTKEPGQGSGLGLSVSFSLIKRLGGHIAIESRLGEGATFTIELPRQVQDSDMEKELKLAREK